MSTPPPPESPESGPSDHGLQALERLRERIEAAVTEIERLRAENAALNTRVQALTAEVGAPADGKVRTALALGEDPDVLRKKVEGFIKALDQMLAEPDANGTSSEPAS